MTDALLVHDRLDETTCSAPQRGLHVGPALWDRAPLPAAHFRPARTEPGRRVRALVDALAAAGDPQTVLTTLVRPGGRSATSTSDVRVLAVPARTVRDLPLARLVSRAMSLAGTVDVVHLHLLDAAPPITPATIAGAVARGRGLVVHLHGSRAMPIRTAARASWRGRLVDALLEGRLLAAADAVIVPSPRMAEVAEAAGARTVAVVPPAVLPVAPPSRARPGTAPADARWVVSVGPLTARRRPEALVAALALQPPGTHLLLLGTGPRRLEVDRTAQRLGLTNRVHVVPTVSWQVVTDHVAHADVTTTAALSGEDPTAVLMAMAAGRPTVATAVEALPALVSHGVDGLLVTPGDDEALAGALRSVLTDTERAIEMGTSARRRSHAADWQRAAARVRGVLSVGAAGPRARR